MPKKLILPLRKFTIWHLRGTVSSDMAAVLFCACHQSSPVTFFPQNDSESSKERVKGTVGKRKAAPHPTFLPTQSRRPSGGGRTLTKTLAKGRNEIEATDAETTWAVSHSQLLNLYTSRINCINSGV